MALWDDALWDGEVSSDSSSSGTQGGMPRVGLFPQGRILWSDGKPFNGFALFGLIPPTADGISWLEGDLGLSFPTVTLPQFAKVPIVKGYLNSSCGLFYNEDISPPETTYNVRFYDTTKRLIDGPSAAFTVTTNPINSIPEPTLTTPNPGGTLPSPD